jgi:esterase/lipase superfamily enzyme
MTKVIIASNRSVDESCHNENIFGHGFNASGPCEVRVAMANREPSQSEWTVTIFAEDHATPEPHQSIKDHFASAVTAIRNNSAEAMKWVVFVPGYCSPCSEGLSKAAQLVEESNVNVIVFSWPSDPVQPDIDATNKYRDTQGKAKLSADALKLFMQELSEDLITPARNASEKFRITLIFHSLGNFMLENYIKNHASGTTNDCSMFDNVVLHQADVNFDAHQGWVTKINARQLTCITTNLHDATLGKLSHLINGRRLGTEPTGVYTAAKTIHVDFTGAHNVTVQHWFFAEIDNRVIEGFCRAIAQGETGLNFLYPDPAHPGRYQTKPFVEESSHDPRTPGLH